MGRIVVGVDGSQPSQAALEWAVAEAFLSGAEVEVVHAWSYPPMTYVTGLVPPPVFAQANLAAKARSVVDDACKPLAGVDVTLTRIVEEGPPARCLVERAAGADLLVVGSRGHGGLPGLLLGSVSQQCAQHAPCPVVIVR